MAENEGFDPLWLRTSADKEEALGNGLVAACLRDAATELERRAKKRAAQFSPPHNKRDGI